jgi:hypothetical protein
MVTEDHAKEQRNVSFSHKLSNCNSQWLGHWALLRIFAYFIYASFSDIVSNSHYIVSNGRMSNELERIWKEAVVFYLRFYP